MNNRAGYGGTGHALSAACDHLLHRLLVLTKILNKIVYLNIVL
jgi:hypothetical protein